MSSVLFSDTMGTCTLTVLFIYWASAALNLITDGTEVHKYRLVEKASSEKVIYFPPLLRSSTLVECASFCSTYEGSLNTLPCNAFTLQGINNTCRLLNVWDTNELLEPIHFDGFEMTLHVRDDIDISRYLFYFWLKSGLVRYNIFSLYSDTFCGRLNSVR